ncbi:MAG: hypothetical protein LBI87_09880 [Candidatus Accumulibacter sp.]|nr:hypothetical protein [Accumulibacter sp.]
MPKVQRTQCPDACRPPGAIAVDSGAGAAPPPHSRPWRLAYHLAVVLAVKLVLLALLWHAFIKPNKVRVDVDVMGSRIAGAAFPAFSPAFISHSIPTSPGDPK